MHSNFLDRATFSIHQTKKTSILPGLLESAWKFFLPINFWFFNENQSNLLVFSPQFQESPPFGHLSVKRATLFQAFFDLLIFDLFWQWFRLFTMHVIKIDKKQNFELDIYEIRLNFDTPLALKWLLMATFLSKNGFWKLLTC